MALEAPHLLPTRRSQSRTVPSCRAESAWSRLGNAATAGTQPLWPSMRCTSWLPARSQTRTVPSDSPETARRPQASPPPPQTQPLWPARNAAPPGRSPGPRPAACHRGQPESACRPPASPPPPRPSSMALQAPQLPPALQVPDLERPIEAEPETARRPSGSHRHRHNPTAMALEPLRTSLPLPGPRPAACHLPRPRAPDRARAAPPPSSPRRSGPQTAAPPGRLQVPQPHRSIVPGRERLIALGQRRPHRPARARCQPLSQPLDAASAARTHPVGLEPLHLLARLQVPEPEACHLPRPRAPDRARAAPPPP